MKLKNNWAYYGWGFATCFLLMCVAFTYILFRDGPAHIPINPPSNPNYYPPWVFPLILSVFWAAGIGIANYMASLPCVLLEVGPGGSVRIERRYPFRKDSRTIGPADLVAAELVEREDADGDPYYAVRLTASDGFTADIVESSDKRHCEAVLVEFLKARSQGRGTAGS